MRVHMKEGDLVKLECKPALGLGVVIEQSPPADVCALDPQYDPIFKVIWMGYGRCWYSDSELKVVSESR